MAQDFVNVNNNKKVINANESMVAFYVPTQSKLIVISV